MSAEKMGVIGCVVFVMAVEAQAADRTVAVYCMNESAVPFQVVQKAHTVTKEIFARVGVTLVIHHGAPPNWDPDAIGMKFETGIRASAHPGALAYALPFGDASSQIYVLVDRMEYSISCPFSATLLGYVMAHELAHVLQAMDSHSARGIMKAHWDSADFAEMANRRLNFAPDDIELIHMGMDGKASRRVSGMFPSLPRR